MPFPPLNQPSMALGLLKATLKDTDISVKTLYPCLWFAEKIGLDLYAFICDTKQEFLAGEWAFAGSAFPDFSPEHNAYLDAFFAAPVTHGLLRKSKFGADPRKALWKVREAASDFIAEVAFQILEFQPKIVGCTSTFMQHCASLAVLKKIHELDPSVITMIGGANCEGEMGIAAAKCFPWLDFVVSGEADLLFPQLCRKLLASGKQLECAELPEGVLSKRSGISSDGSAPRAAVQIMDQTPTPDFDDYFQELQRSTLETFIFPALAMETSRGCWWGKVHHCTFCGLNGGNMGFRSKSPDTVIAQLEELSRRHGIRKFNIVDNILDLHYIQTLLPRLPVEEPYKLFFETKSNLKREQLKTIADAGIRRLQPGIENMHDGVLRLIDKGTTALVNVRLLKWARELGIFITWNFLWDIPGEKEEWYDQMAGWLPLICHLQPPGVDRIQFHRFSPFHQRPDSFGLSLLPYPLYSYVYPLASDDLRDLAYYFHDSYRRPAREELERRPHLKKVLRVIGAWNKLWGQGGMGVVGEKPLLIMRHEEPGHMYIEDSRPGAHSTPLRLEGLAYQVYKECDDIQTINRLMQTLEKNGHSGISIEQVQETLNELESHRLLLNLDGKFIGLALREVRAIPDSLEDFPGGYVDLESWRHECEAVAQVGA